MDDPDIDLVRSSFDRFDVALTRTIEAASALVKLYADRQQVLVSKTFLDHADVVETQRNLEDAIDTSKRLRLFVRQERRRLRTPS